MDVVGLVQTVITVSWKLKTLVEQIQRARKSHEEVVQRIAQSLERISIACRGIDTVNVEHVAAIERLTSDLEAILIGLEKSEILQSDGAVAKFKQLFNMDNVQLVLQDAEAQINRCFIEFCTLESIRNSVLVNQKLDELLRKITTQDAHTDGGATKSEKPVSQKSEITSSSPKNKTTKGVGGAGSAGPFLKPTTPKSETTGTSPKNKTRKGVGGAGSAAPSNSTKPSDPSSSKPKPKPKPKRPESVQLKPPVTPPVIGKSKSESDLSAKTPATPTAPERGEPKSDVNSAESRKTAKKPAGLKNTPQEKSPKPDEKPGVEQVKPNGKKWQAVRNAENKPDPGQQRKPAEKTSDNTKRRNGDKEPTTDGKKETPQKSDSPKRGKKSPQSKGKGKAVPTSKPATTQNGDPSFHTGEATRLMKSGDAEGALKHARMAVSLHRQIFHQISDEASTRALAGSLTSLSHVLNALRRDHPEDTAERIAALKESADLCRLVYNQDDHLARLDLAIALYNLSAEYGQQKPDSTAKSDLQLRVALGIGEEAVGHLKALCDPANVSTSKVDAATCRSHLASAYRNLSLILSDLDLHDRALSVAEDGVKLCYEHTMENGDLILHALLMRVSYCYTNLGRNQQAKAVAKEADGIKLPKKA